MRSGDVSSDLVVAAFAPIPVNLDAPRQEPSRPEAAALMPIHVEHNATGIMYNLSFSQPAPLHTAHVELRDPEDNVVDSYSTTYEQEAQLRVEDYTLEPGRHGFAFWTEGPIKEVEVRGWVAVNYWPREHHEGAVESYHRGG